MKESFIKLLKRGLKKRGVNLKFSTLIMLLLGSSIYATEVNENSSGIIITSKEGANFYTINGEQRELTDDILIVNGDINDDIILPDPEKAYSTIEITDFNNSNFNLELNGNIFVNNKNYTTYLLRNNGTIGNITLNGKVTTEPTYYANCGIGNTGNIAKVEINGAIDSKGSYIVYNQNSNSTIDDIINNGNIKVKLTDYINPDTGSVTKKNSAVLINNLGNIGQIENNGIIFDTNDNNQKSIDTNIIIRNGDYYSRDANIDKILNRGKMSTVIAWDKYIYTFLNNYGIQNRNTIGEIINDGTIEGFVYISGNSSYTGIDLNSNSTLDKLKNRGVIYSTTSDKNTNSKMFGVYMSNTDNVGEFINTGVIYGRYLAYYRYSSTVNKENNYGLFLEKFKTSRSIDTKGLEVQVNDDNSYSLIKGEFGSNFEGVEIDGELFTVKNANSIKDGDKITGTESIEVTGNSSNIIYNGLTDSIKVKETANLDNVVVNGYKSTIVFDEAGGSLTLNNSIVNGGVDREYDNTGTLLSNSFTIRGSENNDNLTLLGNTIINGKIDLGGGDDTLSIGEKTALLSEEPTSKEERYILDDVLGAENININDNVTIFEDVKIVGAKNINIDEDTKLSLRLKVDGNTATHSLFENEGLLIVGEGNEKDQNVGRVSFITSELGKDSVINIGNTQIENTVFETNSILDEVKVNMTGEDGKEITITIKKDLDEIINPKPEEPIDPDDPDNPDDPDDPDDPDNPDNPDDPDDPDNPDNPDDPTDPGIQLPDNINYSSLDAIYKSAIGTEENTKELKSLISGTLRTLNTEQEKYLVNYLAEVYTMSPYSYSSELSKKSVDIFKNIVKNTEDKLDPKQWRVTGGMTHLNGEENNRFFGKNRYNWDNGKKNESVDNSLYGLYSLGEYGIAENLSLGVIFGANNVDSKLANHSKVDGTTIYIGGFLKKYIGNMKLVSGIGYQYGDYEAKRYSTGADKIRNYEGNYRDNSINAYLDLEYSHLIGKNLFLKPSLGIDHTYIYQNGAKESGLLSIETDSKTFNYTTLNLGLDLQKNIIGNTLSQKFILGSFYKRALDGYENDKISARFNGSSNFDLLVLGQDKHKVGIRAGYEVELKNGMSFALNGNYTFARDEYKEGIKKENKGEWILGIEIGYKF